MPFPPIDIMNQGITHPPDEDEICMICQENLNDGFNNKVHTLECKHKYHTACIIAWFRSGRNTCPYCSSTGTEADTTTTTTRHRWRPRFNSLRNFKRIMDYSRRRDAPKELVNMVNKLRILEEKCKDAKTQVTNFRNNIHDDASFKVQRTRFIKLQRTHWSCERAIYTQKQQIDSYPVIPLVIPSFRPIAIPSHPVDSISAVLEGLD